MIGTSEERGGTTLAEASRSNKLEEKQGSLNNETAPSIFNSKGLQGLNDSPIVKKFVATGLKSSHKTYSVLSISLPLLNILPANFAFNKPLEHLYSIINLQRAIFAFLSESGLFASCIVEGSVEIVKI